MEDMVNSSSSYSQLPLKSRPGFVSFLKTNIVLCSAILAVMILFLFGLKIPINEYDEGFVVLNAARIIDGEILYRDFYSPYPPGQFYTLALIFSIFGKSILVARLYDLIIRVALVGVVFAISKRIMPRHYALFVSAGAVALLIYSGYYLYPVFPSLLFTLLGVLLALKPKCTEWYFRNLWPGILLGCAACFRLDVAFAGVMAVVVYILGSRKEGLIHLLLGFLLVAIPVYSYFFIKSGWSVVFNDLVRIPYGLISKFRRTPYPSFLPQITANTFTLRSFYIEIRTWVFFYLPLLVYCFACWRIVQTLLFAKWGRKINVQLAALSCLGIVLFLPVVSRSDPIHALPTTIVAFTVLGMLISDSSNSLSETRNRLAYLLALVIMVFYFAPATRRLFITLKEYPPFGNYSRLENSGSVWVAMDQEEAVNFVRKHTGSQETIFVGNRRNDVAFMNDVVFYFLADRPPATHYAEFDPGVTTTLAVQKKIVYELGSVRWIVIVDMPLSTEPNFSSVSSGITYMDDFIRNNYKLVHEVGRYQIFYRIT
jgi:hypothetical protein